ncbi:MAG: protoglobin domain-containing protein [Rhodocyclaceae bacterium]|nr:protoglobin domain-containing protein [Rhodocyclaceae bacterium]
MATEHGTKGGEAVEFGLSEAEFEQHKAYLGIGKRDIECLRALTDHAVEGRDEFLIRFYDHMMSFSEPAAVLDRAGVPIDSLRAMHGEQVGVLLSGHYDFGYARDRLRIGKTHHRIGLKPEWYIGAYSQYLGWLMPLAAKTSDGDCDRFLATVMALVKIVLLDIELALGSYFHADHERLRLMARVFESDLEAVLICDPQGSIAEANRIAAAFSGYRLAELVGRNVDALYSPRNGTPFADIWALAVKGGTWYGEAWLLRAGGRDYRAHMSIAAATDDRGRATHYVVEYSDATEEWEAEQALKARTEELDRSNKELEQFAYVASHDLQEPLRMVASYTQLLARRYKDKLDQDANEFIHFAVDGATRMQGLINDLLKYSRVGTRGSLFAATDCGKVLDNALANLAVAVCESGAVVTCDPLPAVIADQVQLTQLFQNLVGNAIKFRKPGEAPRVHIGARRIGDGWEFSVRDNGIGISPEYFERVFDIFQRLHAKEEYPGTGIGLALCKKIVERHGGRIWVASRPEEGATFLFTIRDREGNDNE